MSDTSLPSIPALPPECPVHEVYETHRPDGTWTCPRCEIQKIPDDLVPERPKWEASARVFTGEDH